MRPSSASPARPVNSVPASASARCWAARSRRCTRSGRSATSSKMSPSRSAIPVSAAAPALRRPAAAQVAACHGGAPWRHPAAPLHQHPAMQQPEQRQLGRIDRDHRVQGQAVPRAVVAQAGGGLDRQPMPARQQPRRVRRRRAETLPDRHPPVAQQAADPHLPGPVAATLAHPDRARARHQTAQQQGPAVCRRASPNRPSLVSIKASEASQPAASGSDFPSQRKMCECRSPRGRATVLRVKRVAMGVAL